MAQKVQAKFFYIVWSLWNKKHIYHRYVTTSYFFHFRYGIWKIQNIVCLQDPSPTFTRRPRGDELYLSKTPANACLLSQRVSNCRTWLCEQCWSAIWSKELCSTLEVWNLVCEVYIARGKENLQWHLRFKNMHSETGLSILSICLSASHRRLSYRCMSVFVVCVCLWFVRVFVCGFVFTTLCGPFWEINPAPYSVLLSRKEKHITWYHYHY